MGSRIKARGNLVSKVVSFPILVVISALSGSCVAPRESAAVRSSLDAKECRERFLGKHSDNLILLKKLGGDRALRHTSTPYVDWGAYYGALPGTEAERTAVGEGIDSLDEFLRDSGKGGLFANLVERLNDAGKQKNQATKERSSFFAALLDLNEQRKGLLMCNMYDTNGAYTAVHGNDALKVNSFKALENNGSECQKPEEKRFRTIDGSCNDLQHPKMGAARTNFPRNVSFETVNSVLDRPDLMQNPDPHTVSEKLLSRDGLGTIDLGGGEKVNMVHVGGNYRRAPFFNLLAGAWIQFMTHDWFAHTHAHGEEGQPAKKGMNDPDPSRVITTPNDRMKLPGTFLGKNPANGRSPKKVWSNEVTYWWDASQIYGWDAVTSQRVRDQSNKHLLLVDQENLLPSSTSLDASLQTDLHPHELPQEVTAFADNWWVGLSVLNTAFVREHNRFTSLLWEGATRSGSALRKQLEQAGVSFKDFETPEGRQRVQEEIFQIGRLYISALIAKIHTIEWTPQLIFNPVTDAALNANWIGLNKYLAQEGKDTTLGQRFSEVVDRITARLKQREGGQQSSLLAAVTGIVRSDTKAFQFGSPFALPEEFTTVYRLHPLLPDAIELYKVSDVLSLKNGDTVQPTNVGMPQLVKGGARREYTSGKASLADYALSLGVQEVGVLRLSNYPAFLQQLEVPQMPAGTGFTDPAFGGKKIIDMAAVDILRDRERGVPRFNRFRQEIGLVPFRSFNDFLDRENALQFFLACDKDVQNRFAGLKNAQEMTTAYTLFEDNLNKDAVISRYKACGQAEGKAAGRTLLVQLSERDALMEVYGASTVSDTNALELVDALVGIFAENTRPHGFALSETQFHIFILNASRRLFSDRFFTSSYNKETYTQFGLDELAYRDMRHVLADNFPELRPLLVFGANPAGTKISEQTKFKIPNAFDPWDRSSKEAYSLSDKTDWQVLLAKTPPAR